MHGADRDIVWLQRDFGIYVCNLFDTGQVCLKSSGCSILKLLPLLVTEEKKCVMSYIIVIVLFLS